MTSPQFGITPDGFKIKTREQITTEVHAALKDKFGGSVDLSPDSNFSRFAETIIERQVVLWQLARDVYNSGYRATATGVSLDHVGALINVFRLAAQPTHVTALLSGDEGTVIRAGSLASTTPGKDLFESTEAVTITKKQTLKATVQIAKALPVTDYTVTLNGTDRTVNSATSFVREIGGNENGLIADAGMSGDLQLNEFPQEDLKDGKIYWECVKILTYSLEDPENPVEYLHFRLYKDPEKNWMLAESVFEGIVDFIDKDFDFGNTIDLIARNESGISGTVKLAGFIEDKDNKNIITYAISPAAIASQLVEVIQYYSGDSHLEAVDNHDGSLTIIPTQGYESTPFSITVGDNLELTYFGCPQFYASVGKGSIPCPIGSLSVIQTPISGWDAITNEEESIAGRHTETDDEFRERIRISPRVNAHATKGAIEARLLQEVPSVTLAIVKENITDEPLEDGQLPHTIHVTVQCSDEDKEAVAKKIWELKPAGIPTWIPDPPATGRVLQPITDASGIKRNIYFTRPESKLIWMKVTILHPTEDEAKKLLPEDWQKTLTDSVLLIGSTYTLGQDVAAQRFYSVVLQIPGITSVEVELGYTLPDAIDPGAPPTLYGGVVDIDHNAIAVFDPTHRERIMIGFPPP